MWFFSTCPFGVKRHCKSIHQFFCLIIFILWWNISDQIEVGSSRITAELNLIGVTCWTALSTKCQLKEYLFEVLSLKRLVASIPNSTFKQLMRVQHLTKTLHVGFSLICHPCIWAIWTCRAVKRKSPLWNRVIYIHRSLSTSVSPWKSIWLNCHVQSAVTHSPTRPRCLSF